jgi:hypothetical protein
MTRKLLLVAIAAGLGWWYFIGGRKLSEAEVGDFYRSVESATLSRKPELLCALLADDFRSEGVVSVAGRHSAQVQDKAQACAAYEQLYASWEQIGKNMGGMLQLHSGYRINSLEIASNRQSAKVDISMSVLVGADLMNIRSRSTDTLVRRNGKVVLLRTEGRSGVDSAGL